MVFFVICACFALFPEKVIFGAQNGLAMCINAIIPSLLPFMLLSACLIRSGFSRPLGAAVSKIITPFTKISANGCVCLITGLIGGYGAGVRAVTESYREKMIDKREAERLLGLCNNAGPIFVIGTIGVGFFGSKSIGTTLFVIQVITVIICSMIFMPKSKLSKVSVKEEWGLYRKNRPDLSSVVIESGVSAGAAIISVCTFVITFSAILAVLPVEEYPIISGFFEVMRGCSELSRAGYSSLMLVSAVLSWGGVSVHLQAKALSGGIFDMKKYYVQKITAAFISCGITYLVLSDIYITLFVGCMILGCAVIFTAYRFIFSKSFLKPLFRQRRHS